MNLPAMARLCFLLLLALCSAACGAKQITPGAAGPLTATDAVAPGAAPAARAAGGALAVGEVAAAAYPSPIPITAQDPSWGDDAAPVTIVEFTDLQCPFCGRGHETIKKLEKHYGPQQLRVVVKHYPLPFHDKARPAAVIAAAIFHSHGRDVFWRFVDLCFEELEDESLTEILSDLNLEPTSLQKEVNDGHAMNKVIADLALGDKLGVNGTPHFFVNGLPLSGAQPFEAFEDIIDAQLQAAKVLQAEGLAPAAISPKLTTNNYKEPATPEPEPEPKRDKTVHYVPVGDSPVHGPDSAPITIVEFSDYQCPYCARVQATLHQLEAKYPGKIRFVFKQLPLPFHDRAMPAAQLSLEAYRRQGHEGFWHAKTKLFENSETLQDDDLKRIAVELKLDPGATMKAIEKGKHRAAIQTDQDLAADVGARGTPHFFVNGQRLSGAQPLEKFVEIVEEQLLTVAELRKQGVAPNGVYAHLMKDGKRPDPPSRLTMGPPAARMPSQGSKAAPITVQIFSDFECPFCARTVPTLKKLQAHYGKRIRLVFRHYPLSFHEHAMAAHIASHEVFVQRGNKAFWAYHDLLFDSETLDTDTLVTLAAKVGANEKTVRSAIETEKHKGVIEKDMAVASDGGIEGTPGFVINKGWHIGGAESYRTFQRVIEHALQHP
ncbi:MAG: thioredoxin domain-containing protein [Polyangiaceae bacterium]